MDVLGHVRSNETESVMFAGNADAVRVASHGVIGVRVTQSAKMKDYLSHATVSRSVISLTHECCHAIEAERRILAGGAAYGFH